VLHWHFHGDNDHKIESLAVL